MSPTVQWPRQLGIAALILLAWALVILGFSAQLVAAASFPWERALRINLREWLPWVVLSPLVFRLAHRLPLERGNLHLSLPVYLVSAFASVFLAGLIFNWLGLVPGFAPMNEETELRPPLMEGGELDEPPPRRRNRPPGARGAEGPRFGPPPSQRPPPGPPGMGGRPLPRGQIVLRAKFNFPVYFVIVSMANALTQYRRSQERERKTRELAAHLAHAKLQALRLQLQPHFLFNALNAISTLVHKNPHIADDMIAALSDLLRATLETSDQEIPLRRELEILDRYLEIEQMRLGDRLKVEKDIRESALDLLVPTMVLQPLAENAVRHGIEPRLGPGVVRVEAGIENGRLHLRVRDNGAGFKTVPTALSREGIGLANTRARLRELHGDEASVTILSPTDGGTTVHIELPIKNQHDTSAPV